MGGSIGLGLWDARLGMGPHLAWTLITLANGAMEWLWLAVAVIVVTVVIMSMGVVAMAVAVVAGVEAFLAVEDQEYAKLAPQTLAWPAASMMFSFE
ncbi:hypothetical protein G6F64_015165 [Rhizopus arrhizus]|uniref:Uncharacterized protein n=1 Tax=Rhizopus oryzae TaxID=64495 RepID=A0A9P6WS44_RHIOR|nr:hypothetical protein G6F64_015165 [Rhizopus arrhizus]